MAISVTTVTTGRWRTNCYLVADSTGKSVIIDPGNEPETIIAEIENKGIQPLAILNTHGHYDHVSAVDPIKKRFAVPFYLHSGDDKLLRQAKFYQKLFDGSGPIEIPQIDEYLDRVRLPLTFGALSFDVVHTPGHTSGSVCFLLQDCLFTGDTLFKGGIGRLDLPGADRTLMARSLATLGRMPAELNVYPGHGATTVLGLEMSENTALREATGCA